MPDALTADDLRRGASEARDNGYPEEAGRLSAAADLMDDQGSPPNLGDLVRYTGPTSDRALYQHTSIVLREPQDHDGHRYLLHDLEGIDRNTWQSLPQHLVVVARAMYVSAETSSPHDALRAAAAELVDAVWGAGDRGWDRVRAAIDQLRHEATGAPGSALQSEVASLLSSGDPDNDWHDFRERLLGVQQVLSAAGTAP